MSRDLPQKNAQNTEERSAAFTPLHAGMVESREISSGTVEVSPLKRVNAALRCLPLRPQTSLSPAFFGG